MSDDQAVPPAARLVRDFINTREPQIDDETLNTLEELRDWFAERHLLAADAQLDSADLAAATAVREGLGAVLLGHAVAHLADAIRQCSEDETWPRLKVCARDTCRWAFYDASKNQVRRWCSMAGCGNHIKMQRAYATRKSRHRQPPGGAPKPIRNQEAPAAGPPLA